MSKEKKYKLTEEHIESLEGLYNKGDSLWQNLGGLIEQIKKTPELSEHNCEGLLTFASDVQVLSSIALEIYSWIKISERRDIAKYKIKKRLN